MPVFHLGDKVWWTSQSQGYSKTKEGTIIEIVPAEHFPQTKHFDTVVPRDHESYVVCILRNKLYWPRVNNLKKKE